MARRMSELAATERRLRLAQGLRRRGSPRARRHRRVRETKMVYANGARHTSIGKAKKSGIESFFSEYKFQICSMIPAGPRDGSRRAGLQRATEAPASRTKARVQATRSRWSVRGRSTEETSRKMSPETEKTLVKSTLEQDRPDCRRRGEYVLHRLFEVDASTRSLFKMHDMAEQREAGSGAGHRRRRIRRPCTARSHAEKLGKGRMRYGVADERYRLGRHGAAVDARAGSQGRLDARRKGRMDRRLWHGSRRDARRHA